MELFRNAIKTCLISLSNNSVEVLRENIPETNLLLNIICSNPTILPFIEDKAYCYPKTLSTEKYSMVQVIAVPKKTRIEIYPLIYDYFKHSFQEINEIPYIFNGVDDLVDYMHWIIRCRAKRVEEYRKWINMIKTSKRRSIVIPLIIFVFQNIVRDLIERIHYINKTSPHTIALLVAKTYSYDKRKLLSLQYYLL